MPLNMLNLRTELESRILARTSRRVRNLDVRLEPERIVLSGETMSFYIKQLAQQGVREMLPHVRLENAIQVAN